MLKRLVKKKQEYRKAGNNSRNCRKTLGRIRAEEEVRIVRNHRENMRKLTFKMKKAGVCVIPEEVIRYKGLSIYKDDQMLEGPSGVTPGLTNQGEQGGGDRQLVGPSGVTPSQSPMKGEPRIGNKNTNCDKPKDSDAKTKCNNKKEDHLSLEELRSQIIVMEEEAGEIVLDKDEISILKLPPDFMTYGKIELTNIEKELGMYSCKYRWNMASQDES